MSSFFSHLTNSVASSALRESLDAMSARQKAIANNIANVETPNYKRKHVSFEAELRRALGGNNSHQIMADLSNMGHTQQTDTTSPGRTNGNNVNIDAEIADLAKTSLNYKASLTLLELRGSIIRSAVKEGKP